MTVSEIAKKLNLAYYAGENLSGKNAKGCYIGDLLSLAMSRVMADNVWITIQTNINVVAVASLAEASCVIVADGCVPDDTTIEKAKEQGIILLGGEISAFDAAVALSEMGI
ncbi:MAG: AraC family transcriptional regulator [Clostridia bacterium]|nr:AraC family transcriptional regulator [Clostridia bacterium]